MSQRTLRKVSPVVYVLLMIVLVIFLVPIYMAVITALKNPAEISLSTAWIPPSRPYWKSFADALDLLLPSLKKQSGVNPQRNSYFGPAGFVERVCFFQKPFPRQ